MLESALSLIQKYDALQKKLYDAEWLSHEDYAKLSKEISKLKEWYEIAVSYRDAMQGYEEAKHMMANAEDEEMIMLAKEEYKVLDEQIPLLEESLKIALLPKDPNDDKNVFIEIRPAAWGNESSLFSQEILRSYMMYSQAKWWKTEIVDQQDNDSWWIKLAIIRVSWDSVYSLMKYESGVHRVQRIPETESQWRVHTSTVTVAIMPEVDDVDFHFDAKEVEMDTFAASSAGGQNANKNQTWVRLRHIPSGIIVTIADSKSQMQNKEKAFVILKSKLYQAEIDKQHAEQKDLRWSQIWTGDRSEKIRTYNFPQDRVTDHRIKESRSNIAWILNGDLEDILNKLIIADQTAKLSSL